MGWVGSELLFVTKDGSSFCRQDEVMRVVRAGIENGIQQPRWREEGVGSPEVWCHCFLRQGAHLDSTTNPRWCCRRGCHRRRV